MSLADRLRRANERWLPGRLLAGPQWLVLGVNNFCNLRCRMCDVGTGHDTTNFGANLTGAHNRSLPIELFTRIVDQLATHYPHTKLGYAYTEPLAWAPLGHSLQLARERGITTTITTNGLLLARRAAEIVAGGCSQLFVSLDGPAAIHDQIRGRQGSYARAVEGIERVAALAGAPPISVVCAITPWNVGQLEALLEALTPLPLTTVVIAHNNFISDTMAAQHNGHYGDRYPVTASNVHATDLDAIDPQQLATELTALRRRPWPFQLTLQPECSGVAELTRYYRQPEQAIGSGCGDLFRILMIDPDGEAIPAHGRCFRLPIGNISTQTLPALWNAAPLAALRRELVAAGGLLPACHRCCGGVG